MKPCLLACIDIIIQVLKRKRKMKEKEKGKKKKKKGKDFVPPRYTSISTLSPDWESYRVYLYCVCFCFCLF